MKLRLLNSLLMSTAWLISQAFGTMHDVSISNFAFVPQSLSIQPGDTVRWSNNDSAPHTTTATDGSFDSGNMSVGTTFTWVFPQTGSFAYVCLYHSNMTGVVNAGTTGSGDTSWVELDSPTNLPLTDVRFWDSQTGWIAGEQGILRTTDGGDTWIMTQTPEDVEALYFISATEGWACGNDGYLVHTTNGGESWTPQSSGVAEKIRDIWFADAQNGWACGRDGLLIRTINGGQSWSPQSSPANDDLRGIYMLNSQSGWMVGSDGLIIFTDNGGSTWEMQLSVPGGEEDEFEAVMALDANTAWAAGGQGRIYHTANGGENWTPQTSGTTVALMDIYFTGPNDGWVCGAGGFLAASMSNGEMWHTQEPPVVATFNSVYFVGDSLGFMVTADGRIFRRKITAVISSAPRDHPAAAESFELIGNYPNPFNPRTTIEFSLNTTGHTTLTVFDILGQVVAQPVNEPLRSGRHQVNFSAGNLPSGVYFYQLTGGGQIESRKMILLK